MRRRGFPSCLTANAHRPCAFSPPPPQKPSPAPGPAGALGTTCASRPPRYQQQCINAWVLAQINKARPANAKAGHSTAACSRHRRSLSLCSPSLPALPNTASLLALHRPAPAAGHLQPGVRERSRRQAAGPGGGGVRQGPGWGDQEQQGRELRCAASPSMIPAAHASRPLFPGAALAVAAFCCPPPSPALTHASPQPVQSARLCGRPCRHSFPFLQFAPQDIDPDDVLVPTVMSSSTFGFIHRDCTNCFE